MASDTLSILDGSTFIVSDRAGDVESGIDTPHRLFYRGRFLSRWRLRLDRRALPIEYHNGAIWSHVNALIAAGLRRYGYTQQASQLAHAVLEAATYFKRPEGPGAGQGRRKQAASA